MTSGLAQTGHCAHLSGDPMIQAYSRGVLRHARVAGRPVLGGGCCQEAWGSLLPGWTPDVAWILRNMSNALIRPDRDEVYSYTECEALGREIVAH